MARFAFKMKLKPGCQAEYKRRHELVWPELTALLNASGIRNYSIYLDEETDTLFAVQEQQGASSQDLGNHSVVQRWWAFMADIMETNPDNSPVSTPLTEVFYLP